MLFLTNAPILPLPEKTREATIIASLISLDEAKSLVKGREFVSAVGHQSTAEALSLLLEVPVPFNRAQVFLQEGDEILAFSLKARIPEGKVLNLEELLQVGFTFTLIKRVR
ncbi:MAG: STIV orfB116 family protein [Thermoplasmata archaeon]